MRIAVIGASGMLGQPVARKLIEHGHEVTLLSRRPEALHGFEGTPIARADLFDAASLREAFRGKDAVYLNLSIAPGARSSDRHAETDGLRIALAAARAERVRRVGLISSLVMRYQGMEGFDWWAFEVKQEAVRILRASGLPHLIFYPSSFMENFSGSQRSGDKIMLAGKSLQKMWFIAGEDYGEMVSRAFRLPEGESREYPIQGPEGFTYDEAARVYVENYPKATLRISRVPAFPLRVAALFSPKMNYVHHILTALNRYPETFESERSWEELGRPKITLAAFARNAP
ncbi:MAG TPA: SDR family oxidoreductase [Thermoanaerobaculia bacterium]|nr:SDR family oxidoreductase [Thermoanaerobaculia bacterium]